MNKTIGEVFGMTYKEAIDELREMYRDGNYIEESLDASDKELAIDIAIEAIEKQIPKKSKLIAYNKEKHVGYAQCPMCHGMIIINQQHCENCGQRIDWKGGIENDR